MAGAKPNFFGIASGALSIYGGIEANRRSKKEARNAKVAGQINAAQTRREGNSVAESIVATTVASGLGVGVTTEDLILESMANAEFDAQMQIYGSLEKASSIRAAGKAALMRGLSDGLQTIGSSVGSGG